MQELKTTLNKIPIVLMAVLYCGYLCYDYYDWLNSPRSTLGMRRSALDQTKKEFGEVKKKVAAADEFYRNLDTLRSRIRELMSQLEATKTTLSADIDIASFVNMLQHEAKRLNLTLKGIAPAEDRKKEYYIEVPFTVNVRGAYVQVLVFFDRIAKLQQVIRIADFQMKPSGNNLTKYVELDSAVKLVTFKYLGTHADELLSKAEMKDGITELPVDPSAATSTSKKPGGK